ncbi:MULTISPECIES: TIGR01457 family HAD-type hydrolase [Clostridia]|uniref:TIGR01457 family HAD-type hydrolase n=1 Tax=Clostridia TaxID=186801 RepID=UPI000EA2CE77|nr:MULTISPECIES: TIGR01457 family HAD-type hydrolase [Clostridia]NBJ69251.1 TIGR01457 family HAD-type hydrolase [Roseburia sp. 1XD42-34]RKI79220.1 TIGR01457 family HAD-type hydrolase [Clostridium sp. 1xD42-85]
MTKAYQGYLIDLDGTMYQGNEPIPYASDFVQTLHHKQIPYVFVTNNSSKTQEDVAAKLRKLDIPAEPDQIVTTSLATASYIKANHGLSRCYVIGEEGLHKALREEGHTITETEDCDMVVIGIDRNITYEKLAKASIAVRNGATFISTNGDKSIPNERGLLPGNGSLTAVISICTGVDPIFIGKPEAVIMEEALEVLGLSKEKALMVGDNYATDIQAGIRAGIDTLMVFTGVTPFSDYEQLAVAPTHYVHNLKEWMEKL